MSSILVLLLFLSIIGLIWGLTAPHHLAKKTRIKRELTRTHASLVFIPLIVLLFILFGITAPAQPTQLQQASYTAGAQSHNSNPKKPTVTAKQVTETKPVVYSTLDQNDSSLPKGQIKVLQNGQNGTETLTYTITHTNGKQIEKTLISDVVTTQPINKIVTVGTYVAPAQPICTNGSYINSSGNTVCTPETTPSVPPGATAQCVDGTYSFSQSHSGTCSHHGGVSRWL